MKVTGQFHAPASLSHRKKSWYILYKRVDISQSQGGCFRPGENPMSLLGLKPSIFPPIAYTKCQLCCPVSKHCELVLFIYLCIYLFISFELELEQFSQYTNSLQYGRFGFQVPVGRDICTLPDWPQGSPSLHHNV